MSLGATSRFACLLLVGGIAATIGCGNTAQSQTAPAQPEMKPAPSTPIAEKKAELGDEETWNPDWDKIVEEALPEDLLTSRRERAVRSLCPQFKNMKEADKRAFWAYFFQALAGAEAGLKPTANVRHSDPEVTDTVTKRTVRQEGLLQLTYMDAKRYGCDFDWAADRDLPAHDPAKTILEPKNNLLCGIKILDNQLVAQHKSLLTEKSYWVTLRPGTYSYLLFMKQMKNVPEACGPTPIRRGWFSRHRVPPASEAGSKPVAPTRPAGASPSSQPDASSQPGAANQPASAGVGAVTASGH